MRPILVGRGLFAVAALWMSHPAAGAVLSYSGVFSADDNVVQFPFTLASSSLLTIQTLSFANGGFEPILTLFAADGSLITQDSTGGSAPAGCGPRGTDPVLLYCLDAYISISLSAADYFAVLTEADNAANGPGFADGFVRDGGGNFTGPAFTGKSRRVHSVRR